MLLDTSSAEVCVCAMIYPVPAPHARTRTRTHTHAHAHAKGRQGARLSALRLLVQSKGLLGYLKRPCPADGCVVSVCHMVCVLQELTFLV
jgi:hypothetical protein